MPQRQLLQNNHNFSGIQEKDNLRSHAFSEFINCVSVAGADNQRHKKTAFSYHKRPFLSIMRPVVISAKL